MRAEFANTSAAYVCLFLCFFCAIISAIRPFPEPFSPPPFPMLLLLRQIDATTFSTLEGAPSAYLGCPHPQAFLEASIGATVAPLWHLGPCALLTEPVDLAPYMFALGPEYTGLWAAESPLAAVSSANGTRVLRHLQVGVGWGVGGWGGLGGFLEG